MILTPRRALRRVALGVWVLLALAGASRGQTPPKSPQDLKRLSIEELAQLEVSSVSRRSERLSGTSAAVTIVRYDDIRRSAATTLAEAMRLAGGLDVARADSRTWAISARGFTITSANKLLVMIDGRTVYSPLFAGTFWDVQDALFADVDRIEVVRGPGGSTWGANAVNGVVNIIMKDAAETRGAAGFLGVGTDERLVASARYGAALAPGGSYRVYGKYRHRSAETLASGGSAGDEIDFGQGGFRIESRSDATTRWFVQGDAYKGSEGQTGGGDVSVSGGNVVGRWGRALGTTGRFQAQAYYDNTSRTIPSLFDETRHTAEIDAQHRVLFRDRHDVVAGGTFRVTHAKDRGFGGLGFAREQRTDALFSLFAQDEFALRPRTAFLMVGSKFERNDLTGVEVQPTVRFRWSRGDRGTFWTAVSRAVRLPTRFDTDLRIDTPAISVEGSADFDSEKIVAYEAGYRAVVHPRLSLDLAAFANRYDDLRSQEQPLIPGGRVVLGNTLNATTSGAEVAVTVQPHERWRVIGSYAFLEKDLGFDPGSRDITRGVSEGNDAAHRFSLRTNLDLPKSFELDGMFRYVGRRPAPLVPAYAELDVRLGWNLRPALELSIVGQNLLHDRHREFGAASPGSALFSRGAYARALWRF